MVGSTLYVDFESDEDIDQWLEINLCKKQCVEYGQIANRSC